MRVTLTLCLAGLALGATAAGVAQTPGKAPPQANAPQANAPASNPPKQSPPQASDFRSLDKDSDGFVSLSEAEPAGALHDVFAALDRNQDGKLSAVEFATWSGADKTRTPTPASPATGPGGSGNAQHMPDSKSSPR